MAEQKMFRSIKAKADAKRTRSEKIADWMTSRFGSVFFLTINIILFILWIVVNDGYIQFIPVFDPFPYNLLTMSVSLEAIILAVFVLISQNRDTRVAEIREEIHLQINLIAEKEITKVMKMLAILMKQNGIDLSKDPELKKLIKPISEAEIEAELKKEILRSY